MCITYKLEFIMNNQKLLYYNEIFLGMLSKSKFDFCLFNIENMGIKRKTAVGCIASGRYCLYCFTRRVEIKIKSWELKNMNEI